MSRPTILTVDDDPQVLAAISRDLVTQYGAEYRVVRASLGRKPWACSADSTSVRSPSP